jgi:hypothetical protein
MSVGESVYFLGYRFDAGSIEEAVCNILDETRGDFKYVLTPKCTVWLDCLRILLPCSRSAGVARVLR